MLAESTLPTLEGCAVLVDGNGEPVVEAINDGIMLSSKEGRLVDGHGASLAIGVEVKAMLGVVLVAAVGTNTLGVGIGRGATVGSSRLNMFGASLVTTLGSTEGFSELAEAETQTSLGLIVSRAKDDGDTGVTVRIEAPGDSVGAFVDEGISEAQKRPPIMFP
jgi:hypothetical protein